MSRRQLKKDVLAILQKLDLHEIYRDLDCYQPQKLLYPLFIALCHREEHVRWHAISCFGRVVPTIAAQDTEAARVVMRRFLWSLNDESGGIGWGSPEAMAEIMCKSSLLRKEYLHMLISYMRDDGEELYQDGNFLELPLLQRGLLWGVGRLCQDHREEMIARRLESDVAAYLESPDRYVVGLATWCLALLGSEKGWNIIKASKNSELRLTVFLKESIQNLKVDELIQQTVAFERNETA